MFNDINYILSCLGICCVVARYAEMSYLCLFGSSHYILYKDGTEDWKARAFDCFLLTLESGCKGASRHYLYTKLQ